MCELPYKLRQMRFSFLGFCKEYRELNQYVALKKEAFDFCFQASKAF